MKKLRPWLISIPLVLSLPAGAQVELKHFWNFEDPDLGLDVAGEINGTLSDPTNVNAEPGHSASSTAAFFPIPTGGDADRIPLAGYTLFQPEDTAFSISYWIKMPNDGTTDPRGIFDFSSNGDIGVQSLFIGTTGELAFRIDFATDGFALVKIADNLEDDKWHFVVATYDPASGLEVHLDGFGSDGSSPNTGEVSFNSDSYLGSFNFTGASANKGLGGNLDDFAIYSGKLEETQIASLFEKTVSPLDFLPIDPESTLAITSVVPSLERNVITWPSVAGTTYSIWQSPDLENWFELDDAIDGTNDPVSYTHEFLEMPERIFYRISIN